MQTKWAMNDANNRESVPTNKYPTECETKGAPCMPNTQRVIPTSSQFQQKHVMQEENDNKYYNYYHFYFWQKDGYVTLWSVRVQMAGLFWPFAQVQVEFLYSITRHKTTLIVSIYCDVCGCITVVIHHAYKALLSRTTHNSGNIDSRLMTFFNILSNTM